MSTTYLTMKQLGEALLCLNWPQGSLKATAAGNMTIDELIAHCDQLEPSRHHLELSGYIDQRCAARDAILDMAAELDAEGWVVVPREPTEAMVDIGEDALGLSAEERIQQTEGELVCWQYSQCIYRAMLSAAPLPHQPETK